MKREQILLRRVRWLIGFFIFGLFMSGATAMPLVSEVNWLAAKASSVGMPAVMIDWLTRVQGALNRTQSQQPFLFYGTDCLAFGHFAIAIVFIGAIRDPVRNRWLFDFGLIACALVVPYALICGGVRGIPVWWRLIDCSFGVVGAVPLWFCRRWACEVERLAADKS